jgi:alpha-beta hydrolase superfamily lysophospholipase
MHDGCDKSSGGVDNRGQPPAGLLVVVGGVGGLDWCGIAVRHVVKVARMPYSVQLFPWGHGFLRWHADLTSITNRDARAKLLAETIGRFKTDHPRSPIVLVAKSGGSGVCVKAFELLDEETVERAVLLAPALSPRYDLTAALRAVRRDVVVFWSPLDVIVLGLGTRLFGTVDRVRTVSAGLVGFQIPPALEDDARQNREYRKLRQIRWHPRMATTGNFGGHLGPDCPFFLKKYVVPLLQFDETAIS